MTSNNSIEAAFYFDFCCPESWLVAERILHTMPVATEWTPVSEAKLSKRTAEKPTDYAHIEQLAALYNLQAVRWPKQFPFESTLALHGATYAKEIGRTVSFSLAAFRQTYAGGHDLSQTETVLIAAAACEIHPNAVIQSIKQAHITNLLEQQTNHAKQLGVQLTPSIRVKTEIFTGINGLVDAASYAQTLLHNAG